MSVRQEENGTWTSQFWLRDYNGERRHKVRRGFETEEEAAECEKSSKLDAEGSVNSTFAAFIEVYKKDMEPVFTRTPGYRRNT
ncbi:Arm DNA-binding domain-containing protein [Berryella wangjianweii]